jgi:hypothetical protein
MFKDLIPLSISFKSPLGLTRFIEQRNGFLQRCVAPTPLKKE